MDRLADDVMTKLRNAPDLTVGQDQRGTWVSSASHERDFHEVAYLTAIRSTKISLRYIQRTSNVAFKASLIFLRVRAAALLVGLLVSIGAFIGSAIYSGSFSPPLLMVCCALLSVVVAVWPGVRGTMPVLSPAHAASRKRIEDAVNRALCKHE